MLCSVNGVSDVLLVSFPPVKGRYSVELVAFDPNPKAVLNDAASVNTHVLVPSLVIFYPRYISPTELPFVP